MSSLPSYATIPPDTASYGPPSLHGYRFTQGDFVKTSKSGAISLRLLGQDENVRQPAYCSGNVIDGVVEVAKPDGISSVEMKVISPTHVLRFLGLIVLDRREVGPERNRGGRRDDVHCLLYQCTAVGQRQDIRSLAVSRLPTVLLDAPLYLHRRRGGLCMQPCSFV